MHTDNFTFTFTSLVGYILEIQFSNFEQDKVQVVGLKRPGHRPERSPSVYFIFYDPLIGLILVTVAVSNFFFNLKLFQYLASGFKKFCYPWHMNQQSDKNVIKFLIQFLQFYFDLRYINYSQRCV
jgi:hypothetical protein